VDSEASREDWMACQVRALYIGDDYCWMYCDHGRSSTTGGIMLQYLSHLGQIFKRVRVELGL